MALMPQDLEEKRFTPVRFSEGYDMDEVDNYLDNEVMPRLQELITENERLARELEEAHSRIAELEAQPKAAAHDDFTPATFEEPARAEEEHHDNAVAESHVVAAPVEESHTAHAVEGVPAQSATGLISLAQRLHDEHVSNGQAERDRLVSEAQAEHERIINEANETSRVTLDKLNAEKAELEKDIETLRTFERDYRTRLRNYLENQLRDLDTTETQDKAASHGL